MSVSLPDDAGAYHPWFDPNATRAMYALSRRKNLGILLVKHAREDAQYTGVVHNDQNSTSDASSYEIVLL